jgi:hypothetical protein
VNSTANTWQLRVLSGWHEGAVVELLGDAGTLTLGTEVQGDVVLRNAPFAQARLYWDAQGWRLEHDGNAQVLAIGQALLWQDVHLVVTPSVAPWACDQALVWPQEMPIAAEKTPLLDDAVTGTSSTAELVQHTETPDLPMAAATSNPPWLERIRQHRSWRLGLLGLGSLLALATVSGLTQWQSHASPSLPRLASPEVPVTPEVSTEQLQAVLVQAGLDQAVRVEKVDGKRHALWGVVQDLDQLEALLRGVMALTRKVVPHVLVQTEFEMQVQSLQSQMPSGIQIAAGPGGQIWLSGAAQAAAPMQEAMALVRRELPEAAQVRVGSGPRGAVPAPALQWAGLPHIVAVQSGQHAYVLLADGRRILPGGQINAWRLVDIQGQAIVLEDATGQSRRLER